MNKFCLIALCIGLAGCSRHRSQEQSQPAQLAAPDNVEAIVCDPLPEPAEPQQTPQDQWYASADEAYDDGYANGWQDGYSDALNHLDFCYSFNTASDYLGYPAHYDQGYIDGYEEGYHEATEP